MRLGVRLFIVICMDFVFLGIVFLDIGFRDDFFLVRVFYGMENSFE